MNKSLFTWEEVVLWLRAQPDQQELVRACYYDDPLLKDGLNRAAQLKNWDVVPMSPVIIGDKVWVGFNVIILKGVYVGEGTVIAAGSVVQKMFHLIVLLPAIPRKSSGNSRKMKNSALKASIN